MVNINRQANALDVSNLSIELDGHEVLRSISFTVSANKTVAIIGPNGAGKSVLLKAILRLLPKKAGSVRIFGVDHEKYHKVAPLISYIPQKMDFDRHFPLTIEGLFSLKSPRPIGMSDTEKQRMHDLLQLVGMSNMEAKKISTLSGGQLQRIMIAYGLMDHPKILMLDEPSAGIDVQGQETIYALLKRIQKKESITMILVSHELDIVMQYADEVLCLNTSLLCSGIPKKILTNEILEQMYGTPIGHFVHKH